MHVKNSLIVIAVCLFLSLSLIPQAVFAIGLKAETSINLKDEDRVSGDMTGNILVYGRPNYTVYNYRLKPTHSQRLKNNVKPVISPNGQYLVLVTYNDHSPTTLQTNKIELYQPNGKFVWKLNKPEATTFELADNGNIYGIEGVPGISQCRIYLYDKYGDRLSIIRADSFHGLTISPSGTKFIVDNFANGLEVFDSTGNSLAEFPPVSNVIMDVDDRYIGTFDRGQFRLYQDEKVVQKIQSLETSLVGIDIDVEHNLLVLLAEKKVEIYDLVAGRLKWEYRVQFDNESFTSLDISPDGQFIVCGSDVNRGTDVLKADRHQEGWVYLIPADGKTMNKQKVTYKSWGIGLPRVFFSQSGASVYVETKDSLTKYRIY